MWVMVVENIDTGVESVFLEGDLSWMKLFDEASLVIGQNILGYDNYALLKMFNYKFPKTCGSHDTMLMSQVLNYKRFGNKGHSLKVWGEFFGFEKIDWRARAIELGLITTLSPKGAEFKQYHPEMIDYCRRDKDITKKQYLFLLQEYLKRLEKNPELKYYLRAEHFAARWATESRLYGWPFNVDAATELSGRMAVEIAAAHELLDGKLGIKVVPTDKIKGVVAVKKPKWLRNGTYDVHTCNWFDIAPYNGLDDDELARDDKNHRMILGEYCRVTFEPLKLSSVTDVKVFLFRNGWEPTEWNYKFNEKTFKKERASPKITEDSLEFLGGDGKVYKDYLTTQSRFNNLRTWIANTDENGRLHGDCILIGTPSMRATHQIIVNVPSVDSTWGSEMRALFGCPPGTKLIGCDSSGNQARGLAHYLGDADFIEILLNGDIHQYNADKMTEVLKSMGFDHTVPRGVAKRVLYAFLFGAAGAKLWSYIMGIQDPKRGNKFRNGFLKAVPGFKGLIDKLENIYGSTSKFGDGYIPSIVGTPIYVDSFHKLLVYLLQALEKITCSTALMLTMENLEKEGIPYQPCIFYHDEIDFFVPEEFAERAAQIGKEAFRDGPKLYGIEIMDGSGLIGNNWLEIH
jgi:hypothetical protein